MGVVAESLMRVVALSLRSFTSPPLTTSDPALYGYLGYGRSASGASVNEYTALNYSAWWSAVQIIANGVASLPLQLFKSTGPDQSEKFLAHPLYRVLSRRFNPEMSSFQARKTMQAHVLTWGNAYAEIERDEGGRPLAIWPLTPNRVTPDRDETKAIIYRVRNNEGRETIVPAADMIHVPGLGFDGIMGYSVVRMARETIGLGLTAERYGAQFFRNGAVSSITATHPGKLSDLARTNMKESIEQAISGEKRHSVLVLEEGVEIERISIPPDDAQFLETRKYQDIEVCRWFNLPPHKLAEMDRATFSNIEHQAIEFVIDTLTPWLVGWEHELEFKLIRPLELTQQFIKNNVSGQMRGDVASRGAWYALGRQWGWFSTNDVRRLEDMNTIGPDGDRYLVPMNMSPADRLDDLIDKQVEPAPKPATPAPAAEKSPEPQRSVVADARATMIAAQRALVIEALGRMVRKEGHAVRRAAKKGREGFEQWMGEFYPKHEAMLCTVLGPVVRSHLSIVESADDPVHRTAQLVDEYIEQSLRDLETVPDTDVDKLITRWEIQRPPLMADRLMAEELQHAVAN